MKCEICETVFENEKTLHRHLKKHNIGIIDYYHSYFPRHDLFDGKFIEFKDYNQYFNTYFNSVKNRLDWYRGATRDQIQDFLYKNLEYSKKLKEFKVAPTEVIWQSIKGPDIIEYEVNLGKGAYQKINKSLDLAMSKRLYPQEIDDTKDIEIVIDTREQHPLSFHKYRIQKLIFGDYWTDDSEIFIERKSIEDFCGTMSQGQVRFNKELDRAKDLGLYLVILVEESIEKALVYKNYKSNFIGNHGAFALHAMREILRNYDNCQFVFTGSRENSQNYILFLLSQKSMDFREVDLQFYFNNHFKK